MKPRQSAPHITLDYLKAREKMVKEQIINRGIKDPRVIAAMEQVPRHLFVPETLHGQAYGDSALPIGEGQTISQPFMVAFMSEALGLRGDERVLEIGTGSGYQTAILARLADRVYSVERIRSLLERARKVLDLVQCRNVITKLFDGSFGWKEEGPFDAILVTAGSPEIPKPLMDQLKIGGRLVIPVGDKNSQRLLRVRRNRRGFSQENLRECSFVALLGEHGWEKPARKDYGSV
ncbi:MAG: protein-L-isoaspartate(D-aspartate) O-methyltransferase [Thermodesulfobacteriota bacterium]|nr:protein-L-isoaspartate(D-aspartate) O-methyltransferase [Thermodesulfobacteriota bacterium]